MPAQLPPDGSGAFALRTSSPNSTGRQGGLSAGRWYGPALSVRNFVWGPWHAAQHGGGMRERSKRAVLKTAEFPFATKSLHANCSKNVVIGEVRERSKRAVLKTAVVGRPP